MPGIGDVYSALLNQQTESARSHAEVVEKLGGLEAKVEALLIEARKTNGRVTALEKWRYIMVGGGLVSGAVVSALWEVLRGRTP